MRGYFAIGIYHTKTKSNVGTLWRSAYQLGAAYIFTIGQRYQKQPSDTPITWRHIPLYHYASFDKFYTSMPYDCVLTGIEMGGQTLESYTHPERCIYLLGAEDIGLPSEILDRCHYVVELSYVRLASFNVAVAGSIVMYHRLQGTMNP